tara:strand:- start:4893 stop:5513 length:621 start_codon:yes stop_codon:yes gene_type:complete
MASRDIDSTISSRLANDQHSIAFGVSAEFDSGTLDLWTGVGDFTSGSTTYTGAGELLDISNIEENNELSSTNLTITISGLNSDIVTYATTEDYQNRPLTLKMFFFHPDTAEEINNYVLFKGRMDTLTVNDGDTFSVIISAENKLIDLTRPKNLFYTPETQNFLHAGDKGLEFVPRIQEQTVNWGATRSGSGGGSGGGGDVPIYDLR